MTKYDYIPTEFGRTWVASRSEARRGLFTPLSYIDINEGNRFDADVFAQIMYWHEPNTETGESRLTRQKDGSYWLVKNHADWFKETRIKLQTVRKCLNRLKDRKLIIYELGGEKGNVTPWVRVNWEEFERRIKLWMQNNVVNISEKEYDDLIVTLYHTPVTVEQPPCSDITGTLLPDNNPLLPEVKSNTEITSESTKTTSENKYIPANAVDPRTKPESVPVVIDVLKEAEKVIKQTVPAQKNEMQEAVNIVFKTGYGSLNGLYGNFLTGQSKKSGSWKEWQIDDPPMWPEEIVAFGDWYAAVCPEQYAKYHHPPKSPEKLAPRIMEFRVDPRHDEYVTKSGAAFKARLYSEPESQELPPPNPELAAKAEAIIAAMARGEDIHELVS